MVGNDGAVTADDPDDLAKLADYADALAEAVEVALPGWVQRAVAQRWAEANDGAELPEPVAEAARDAAEQARDEVGPALRALLALDVEQQPTGPLDVIRRAVVHPTRVLAGAGVPSVQRDEHARRIFPEDDYDLSPGAFGDLDPSVHEPGLLWGAAKAHVVLHRRRGGPARP